MTYDPWDHAAALGLRVATESLSGPHWAEYIRSDGLIVVHAELDHTDQRAALAHDLVHVERDEECLEKVDGGGGKHEREVRADRVAATRLVRFGDFLTSTAMHGDALEEVAADLLVPTFLVVAYQAHLVEACRGVLSQLYVERGERDEVVLPQTPASAKPAGGAA